MRNEAVIGGRLLKRGALRYTPAGIPLIEFVIGHSSVQVEAGIRRKVQCEFEATAVGELAVRMGKFRHDQALQVTGFLARNRVGNRRVMLRATRVEAAAADANE